MSVIIIASIASAACGFVLGFMIASGFAVALIIRLADECEVE